jgi:chromosome segregation ATPase
MGRKEEIQDALLENLTSQEQALKDSAAQAKERLDEKIAECEVAKKEYPGLVEKLQAKRKLKDRLEVEITQLEERVATAENLVNDHLRGSLSLIARNRADYEWQKARADSFVETKIKEMTNR